MASGSLASYRRKRDPDRTPEPVPKDDPSPRTSTKRPIFVIHEHHASSLHWDLRLERDGVLASWAVPKGLPVFPDQNHLAVHVEDHPLEYATFRGTIPVGEYGAGEVSIWDQGTYDCEKWRPGEVMVVLHGARVHGRYVLFSTRGNNWMIHRMDPAPEGYEPLPAAVSPMLAVADRLPPDDGEWAFELKWDGIRALVWVDGGRIRMVSRNNNDITGSFPELRGFGTSLGSRQALFDGEVVVLGADGRPSFSQLQRRFRASSSASKRLGRVHPASLVLFDLLHVDGISLLGDDYDHRRAALEALDIGAPRWAVTPSFTDVPGEEILRASIDTGLEGVVAKRRTSPYRPGKRSADWVKVKVQRMQEVVVGGYTTGNGSRRADFGALLLGLPAPGTRKLTFVGKVGTGFSESARGQLLVALKRLGRATSPFDGSVPVGLARDAAWVSPALVGEVRYSEWTPDGLLRHPVWRGLRPDKSSSEVRREP